MAAARAAARCARGPAKCSAPPAFQQVTNHALKAHTVPVQHHRVVQATGRFCSVPGEKRSLMMKAPGAAAQLYTCATLLSRGQCASDCRPSSGDRARPSHRPLLQLINFLYTAATFTIDGCSCVRSTAFMCESKCWLPQIVPLDD